MNLRYLAGALALSVAFATAACGDDPPPTQPTPTPTPTPPPPANPVLTAPRADFPAENDQLQTLRPLLRVLNATADVAGARTYEFQISDDPDFAPATASSVSRYYRLVSAQNNIAEGGDGKTQFEVPADLQPTTRFYWRARARQGTVDGPWSSAATFRTLIQGYNRAGEFFDPLTNAQTIGAVVGSVTLTPGRGATINSNESHIRYQLAQTITAGEFSVEIDGVQVNSIGGKTKVMSMYDGNGDITTSDYRATIEKRDAGAVAWRFIAGEAESRAQIETVGAERQEIRFDPGQIYIWRAKWGNNFFNLEIFRGAAMGDRIYDFGKPYAGTYDPTPHVAFLGSPIGRGGPDDASLVGATWRNVYIGSAGRPRPTSLGTASIENPADDPRVKDRGIRLVP
ncbi:MAG: hypothetical protein ABIT71_09930 [Vicinamibacteraceae bacterium]